MNKKFKWLYLLLSLSLILGSVPAQPVEAAEEHSQTVSLNANKATLNVSETIDLDMLGTTATVHWTSHNENVARVDQNGIVKAMNTGKTNITARVGLDVYKCIITVVKPSLKVNKSAITLYIGGTSKSS